MMGCKAKEGLGLLATGRPVPGAGASVWKLLVTARSCQWLDVGVRYKHPSPCGGALVGPACNRVWGRVQSLEATPGPISESEPLDD